MHLKIDCVAPQFEKIQEGQEPLRSYRQGEVRNQEGGCQQALQCEKTYKGLFLKTDHYKKGRKNRADQLLKVKPSSHLFPAENAQPESSVVHRDNQNQKVPEGADKQPSMFPNLIHAIRGVSAHADHYDQPGPSKQCREFPHIRPAWKEWDNQS